MDRNHRLRLCGRPALTETHRLIWYGWDGVERTTSFAETQVKVRRWAGFVGPIFLLLAGIVVLWRNALFLIGRRDNPAPMAARGLGDDE